MIHNIQHKRGKHSESLSRTQHQKCWKCCKWCHQFWLDSHWEFWVPEWCFDQAKQSSLFDGFEEVSDFEMIFISCSCQKVKSSGLWHLSTTYEQRLAMWTNTQASCGFIIISNNINTHSGVTWFGRGYYRHPYNDILHTIACHSTYSFTLLTWLGLLIHKYSILLHGF